MVHDDDFSFSQKSLEIPKNKRWFSAKKRFWETAVSIGIGYLKYVLRFAQLSRQD